ncbi:AraC family transcriptional regulator [Algiphilus sp.]
MPTSASARSRRALGYRSPANFTRAFRNWAGVSPGAYRKGDGAD